MVDFTSVPVIDYSLAESDKPRFISELRNALINVGFLYLSNSSVPQELVKKIISYLDPLFALPQEEKDRIRMVNSQHFLGYNRLGSEFTKGAQDIREQFDFATSHNCLWKPGNADYLRLWGQPQWPSEELLPGFKTDFLAYLAALEQLAYKFTTYVSEAFGLTPNGLDKFFDEPRSEAMQHRGKVVRYPPVRHGQSNQGVGPHFDGGFLTFLLQASPHEGLQVQNPAGQWIPVPPVEGTFVINIGKGLETLTRKVALATSHRVISPQSESNLGPRYSIPFFQNMSQSIVVAKEVLDLPPEILAMRDARGSNDGSQTDSVNFSEYDYAPSGQAQLIGRVKSHPDVAERHYPHLFKQYFPSGIPRQQEAY